MLWTHDEHPGRRVRLAYCLNLHAAEDLDGILDGIRRITLPLRERLAPRGAFGVGLYLPAAVARELASDAGAEGLCELTRVVDGGGLDPFTFNAFPYGGFHRAGLKERVYAPTWLEPGRLEFTRDVARVAAHLARAKGTLAPDAHVSISTHPGSFAAWLRGPDDLVGCARQMALAARDLARIEAHGGPRIVLSLEAEPRASAGDTRELMGFLAFAREEAARVLGAARDVRGVDRAAARHLGTCLDLCHAAVEYEEPEQALRQASAGGPIGKIQFSSALELRAPRASTAARALLLGMDEPVYLHQVTGRGAVTGRGTGGFQRCTDLSELARELERGDSPWLDCESWRCHFHVPVDLEQVGQGLGTTRAHADRTLELCLADPASWTTPELHLEIETYTWDVLPGAVRGAGDLVDGLEREYRHVMGRLREAGWRTGE